MCLDPDKHSESKKLTATEGEVGGVEESGELVGVAFTKLISTMRDDIRLQASTPESHQVQGAVEDPGLVALGFLARSSAANHAAWGAELTHMGLDGEQDESLHGDVISEQ